MPGRRANAVSSSGEASARRDAPEQLGGGQSAAGISARSVVPAPGGTVEHEPPAERLDAVGEPAQAGAALRRRAADAVVAHLDQRVPVRALDADGHHGRARVLGDVGQRLGDHVVGGGLDRAGQPVVELDESSTGSGARVGERLDGGLEPALGQHRGVDAARELAQLLQRVASAPRPRARGRRRPGCRRAASRSISASETSRCCAPSCRLRSSRRRSASPACDDAGARRGELRARLARWPAPGRPARRSPRSAARRPAANGSRLDAGDDHRAPQPPVEEDRRGDGRDGSRARAAARRARRRGPRSCRPAPARRCG